jgi:hypothetical protein
MTNIIEQQLLRKNAVDAAMARVAPTARDEENMPPILKMARASQQQASLTKAAGRPGDARDSENMPPFLKMVRSARQSTKSRLRITPERVKKATAFWKGIDGVQAGSRVRMLMAPDVEGKVREIRDDGMVLVRWDDGSTSYHRAGELTLRGSASENR